INILFTFEYLLPFKFDNALTGAVIGNVNCIDVKEGVKCRHTLYPTVLNGVCPENLTPKCTNACELENILYLENYSCPKNCRAICIPRLFLK
ncbi:MAG: hypothetical protein QXQ79_01130, partial [Candidatus Nanoarchaeia archaeon]